MSQLRLMILEQFKPLKKSCDDLDLFLVFVDEDMEELWH